MGLYGFLTIFTYRITGNFCGVKFLRLWSKKKTFNFCGFFFCRLKILAPKEKMKITLCKNTLLKIPIYIKNAKREREQNLQSNFKSSCPMSLVVMIYTFSRSMIVISIFFRCQDFQSAVISSSFSKLVGIVVYGTVWLFDNFHIPYNR
jgi:hypothetical protein